MATRIAISARCWSSRPGPRVSNLNPKTRWSMTVWAARAEHRICCRRRARPLELLGEAGSPLTRRVVDLRVRVVLRKRVDFVRHIGHVGLPVPLLVRVAELHVDILARGQVVKRR